MRIQYLKLKQWFIALAAAALGMNISCEMPVEYGTPEAPLDTTDAQGNYKATLNRVCLDSIRLTFSDIDSNENGSYRDTSLVVPTHDIHLSGGDGHWYQGEGNVNVNVTLTPKS